MARPDRSGSPARAWLSVEEPGGPGLDVAWVSGRQGPVVTGARGGGGWLGLDRAVLAETDTGEGSLLPAVVALPASASAGVLVEADICGVLLSDLDSPVVVCTLPGHPLPALPLVRVAARRPDGILADRREAGVIIRNARERYRRRRAAGRGTGRAAWLPIDLGERGGAGNAVASRAEEGLRRLPPRFVRGLAGLLDDDERILASLERPPEEGSGLLAWRRARDRRAALLLLTDRQLLWMVDHAKPSRYLLDWGVDAVILPVERLLNAGLRDARLAGGRDRTGLVVETPAGGLAFPLPMDLRPEAVAFSELVRRFLPDEAGSAIRRRYHVEPLPFNAEPAARFRQEGEARRRVEQLREQLAPAPLLAAFYAPRRETVRRSVVVVVTATEVVVEREARTERLPLAALTAVGLALSPLVGRVELRTAASRSTFTYPAPIADHATAVLRLLRHAWANAQAG
jgi:hypothetical protein